MARQRKEKGEAYFKAFPATLRDLMSRKSTTQQELGDYLGLSRQAVSCYCDGSSSPDWETLVKIARFFKISTDYLLGESSTMSTNIEIQAICQYTGLSEEAIENIHKEANDDGAIWALNELLNSRDLNSLNRQIFEAVNFYRSTHGMNGCFFRGRIITENDLEEWDVDEYIKQDFFFFLENLGGELVSSSDASDYYIGKAANTLRCIVESLCSKWYSVDDPVLTSKAYRAFNKAFDNLVCEVFSPKNIHSTISLDDL